MRSVSRDDWWSWTESERDAWTIWFTKHELSIDNIADFEVGADEVRVRVYLRNDKGHRFRDPEDPQKVADSIVTVSNFKVPPPRA